MPQRCHDFRRLCAANGQKRCETVPQPVQADAFGQVRFAANYVPWLCQRNRASAFRWREYKIIGPAFGLRRNDLLRGSGQGDDARLAGVAAGFVRRRRQDARPSGPRASSAAQ